jgi:BMFP domain-containing protein YqiC
MGNISSDAAVKHDNMREELEKAIRLANGLHSHLSKLKLVA